ncbi:MAG: SDR family NAD(P)-dependent oxidoreductase [Candidatus Sumerlaeaceae bacterium]
MQKTESPRTRELALVTGASMGLGEEYARQLAARGVDLVLTARSTDRLNSVAQELRGAVQTHVFSCDLSAPGAAKQIVDFLALENLQPNWLINNAGFGDAGAFEKLSPERVRDICMVNIVALTELTSRLLPVLKAAPPATARIINLSSVAGFQPVPYFNVYSASKAYVLSFSDALHEELKPQGIRVLCVCPGYTATNFAANNGISKKHFSRTQSAAEVVRRSLIASDAGKSVLVTRSHAQVLAAKFAPRLLVRKLAASVARTYTE